MIKSLIRKNVKFTNCTKAFRRIMLIRLVYKQNLCLILLLYNLKERDNVFYIIVREFQSEGIPTLLEARKKRMSAVLKFKTHFFRLKPIDRSM